MIDTTKFSIVLTMPLKPRIPFNQPTYYKGYNGPIQAHLNTSKSDKKFGVYHPSFTYHQNPTGSPFAKYVLNVQLSLPKIIYGNNFVELADTDFDGVVTAIKQELERIGLNISTEEIEKAEAVKIDFSKNIIFNDYTSTSTVIKSISTADISKVYDVDLTKYKNGGQAFHIHTNCEDIVIYDKVEDLKQARVSDKRAIEDDNHIQLKILDKLKDKKGLSVIRFEVRLNGKRKIRASLYEAGVEYENLSLRTLFKTDIAQKVLLNSWNKIIATIPKVPLSDDDPLALFDEITKDPSVTKQQAEAKLGALWLLTVQDTRLVRNLYDKRFGGHTWGRAKNLRDPPSNRQLKTLLEIAKKLQEMKPVALEDFD